MIAADLAHSSLVRPIGTGLTGVAAYLAQEYVAADSLDHAIRQYGPAPADDTLRVAANLAGALDFAAAVDVHHGALHPRDILLSTDETRLTGIGVSRALERVGVHAPVRRPYTAPERAAGVPLDRRSDVFSLAALIFELLTGRRIAGPGAPAADLSADVTTADTDMLRSVFARALAEDPAARFATALEFVNALKGAFTAEAFAPSGALASAASATDPPGGTAAVASSVPLPLDQPEASDRADVEVPVTADPDLPLAAAEAQRYEDVEVAPAIVAPVHADGHDLAPTPNRAQATVWPLALALAIGLAVGYAAGFAVGSRERPADTVVMGEASRQPQPPTETVPNASAATPAATPREFTETPVGATATKSAEEPKRESPRSSRTSQPPPAVATAPDSAGRLLVRTTPAGARVSIDGRDAGVTPATIRDLSRGTHRLRIVRDGYEPEERRIVITRDRPAQSLIVPLARERDVPSRGADSNIATATPGTAGRFLGELTVDSRPSGARVFLDGRLIGTTPLAVPAIGAGEHAVRLERDGYLRWSSSIRVVANEQNRVTASLER